MGPQPAEKETLSPQERGAAGTSPGLRALALAACLLPPCLLAWRLSRFPGWELTDEAYTLSLWARFHEGLGQSWLPTRGCIHRDLVAWVLGLEGWRYDGVWLASLGIYAAFMATLWTLARRIFGSSAAWGAVAVGGLAALPAVQLGSLLSPQLQPLTWTLLALLGLALERPAGLFLWGLACGAALLDYEGWVVAWPGLFVLLLARPAGRRGLGFAAAGFALAAALLAWHGWPSFSDYLAGRRAYSQPANGASAAAYLGANLRDFFLGGGSALPTQGVPGGSAQFPLWALPLLLASMVHLACPTRDRRLRLGLALCAALPFGVFVLYAPAVPSERVLAAWPALCLLAGERLAAGWRYSRAWAAGLMMLALCGGVWEARGFVAGFDAQGDAFYGGGGALLSAARDLTSLPQLEFFSELDAEPHGDIRLALGRRDQDLRQGPGLALVPWQDQPALRPFCHGQWIPYSAGPDQPQRWIYQVPAPELPFFREARRTLKEFWDRERDRFYASVYRDLVAATAAPIANPLLRDALWEARFLHARRLGRPEPMEGRRSLALGMLRVDPLLREAHDSERLQPADAEFCYRSALQRDPRRREAWQGLRALLLRRHATKDLDQLDQAFQKLGPQATFNPFWLRE
jgi:hypothetical protein